MALGLGKREKHCGIPTQPSVQILLKEIQGFNCNIGVKKSTEKLVILKLMVYLNT